MDTRRLILYAALGLICYSLWQAWQQDYSHPQVTTPTVQVVNKDSPLLPELAGANNKNPNTIPEAPTALDENEKHPLISVKTDVLALTIDPSQGSIVAAQLLQYPVTVNDPNTPVSLLYQEPNQSYVANSHLIVQNDSKTDVVYPRFTSDQASYVLDPEQKTLRVRLKGKTAEGLSIEKEFILTKGSYLIQVNYHLNNQSPALWQGYLNTQLVQRSPSEDSSSLFHVGSFTGASYSQPGIHRYQKVPYKQMTKENLAVDAKGGWIAMQQHYFLSAWIPQATSMNAIYTRAKDEDYTIGAVSSPLKLAQNEKGTLSAQLYLGPEEPALLKQISPGLDLTVDYGWLWFLSSALFTLMTYIHSLVGNWGWSIVLVTILIKLIFYRLSASSYRSMAGMRKLQPKLQGLRERYGDDRAKISQATMELYRNEKVNPLGGCLPIVIQIPVFIALYWVLLESVALRQAPFVFWIKDLAVPDPFHVLPIIMGITMFIQQRLNPAPPDPMQARIMMLLPVFFTAIFWNFPAGLVLYWIVNNTLSILQQWYITRKYDTVPSRKQIATAK